MNSHKIIIAAAILAFCAGVGPGQSSIEDKIKTLKNSKFYSTKYDKFKNETTVIFRGFRVADNPSSVFSNAIVFGVVFVFPSNKVSSPVEEFYFIFHSINQEWQYLYSRDLRFLVDGEHLILGKGSHDGKVSPGFRSVSVSEQVINKVARADLLKIANGKTVEFQLGRFEAVLKDERKQTLKDILMLSAGDKRSPQ